MWKRYRFWLIAAIIFQFLAGATHVITLLISTEPASEKERQLMEMVDTFRPDLGPWFHPTFGNLITALSSCFSFVCLLGALTLGYLVWKDAELGLLRGITLINVLIFGTMFLVVVWFTFFLPVTFIGLIFLNLLIGYLLMPKK